MIILGLNAYHADSSAAIFKDGVLIAATEEERFRRIKHWAGFPSQAIEFCLNDASNRLDKVGYCNICCYTFSTFSNLKKASFVIGQLLFILQVIERIA